MFAAPLLGALAPGVAAAGSAATSLTSLLPFVTAGVSFLGVMQEASAMKYQAAVAARNAAIQEENAVKAAEASALEAQDQDITARLQIGDMIAGLSASGIDASSGSALLRRKSARELATRDRQRLADQGFREVEEFRNRAADFSSQASAARKKASILPITGLISGATGFLQGASMTNRLKTARQGVGIY